MAAQCSRPPTLALPQGWQPLVKCAGSTVSTPLSSSAVWMPIGQMIADSVDRMKMSAAPVPLIAVGGGSFLVPEALAGVSQVRRAPHYAVANAVGAGYRTD